MNTLFFDLIHTSKIKRWFIILENIEEQAVMTSADLAKLTDCTMRTIQSDIKELKCYFGQAIRLLGDDDGQHLNLVDPPLYMRKKQELLQKEVLFFFLAALIEGKAKANQEWAIDLSVSPALFGRLKRKLVRLLEENYRVRLTSEDNRLVGEEAAIRQLMSDFYYTLPHHPKNIENRENQKYLQEWRLKRHSWTIDPLLLRQWGGIFFKRLKDGNQLPDPKELSDLKKKLADAFDQEITTAFSLPAQEKAALFLLSLKDEQFIHRKAQQEFVEQFSKPFPGGNSEQTLEDPTVQFFDTMIFLMNSFFQLPLLSSEPNQSSKEALLEDLMGRYSKISTQIKQSIWVSYDLSGTRVLQEWIKETFRTCLAEFGYYSVEHGDPSQIPFVRKLKVINFHQEEPIVSATLALSKIPEKQEIIEKMKKLFNQNNKEVENK